MELSGVSLIGGGTAIGCPDAFRASDPGTGRSLEPAFAAAGHAEVDRACALAWAAFDAFREVGLEARARLLETIASGVAGLGDLLVERAVSETGLPRARIEGERARTVGQLRMFAAEVREGGWLGARIDPALRDRTPLPRPDLRQRLVPLGPVAVFGASNFPLAFSVAGGDTASALAAGCPAVVRAHPAHPGTSELVGRVVQDAVRTAGLPEGVFSLLVGPDHALGQALVADPRVKAVGFTGSRTGGMALMRVAAARPEPIPVFAEMSSVNPVFLLPSALASCGSEIGRGFAASLTMGAGQFCTNPGLVLAVGGPGLDAFLSGAVRAISASPAATMLTSGMHAAYAEGVRRLARTPGVVELTRGGPAEAGSLAAQAFLFATDVDALAFEPTIQQEVFGAASVVIRCPDVGAMRHFAERMEGQLTATLHFDDPGDVEDARMLLPTLERKVGRVLANGWPTGVEVGHAMVHGGPFPATGDGRTTSVGSLAIGRFLRPVCYQDLPETLLPEALRDANPLGLWRRVDGTLGRH